MSDPSLSPIAHASIYLDASPDAILGFDGDGSIVMANQQAGHLFGYERTELIGLGLESLLPEDVRRVHRSHIARYQAAPTPRGMGDPGSRLMARHSSGTLVPVEIALSPVDIDGTSHVMAVVRDVADRLAVERERDIVQRSLDAVDDAVFMFAPDTLEFSYANLAAAMHTGYGRTELTSGMTPVDIKPFYSERQFRTMISALLNGTATAVTFETVHQRRDGAEVAVEISLSYPDSVDPESRPMVSIVRDITERKAAERRLQASEEAFRSAFEDAPVPMAIADLSDPVTRPVLRANRAFGTLLGVDPAGIVGTPVGELTHPDDQGDDLAGAVTLADEGARYTVEKRYRRSDGEYVWGEVHAALVAGPDGRPTSLAHVIDISRRVAAEEERDRREHVLSLLASIRGDVLQEVPLEEILGFIVQSTKKNLAACHCLLATPNDGALMGRAWDSDIATEPAGSSLLIGSLAGGVATTGESLVIDDLSSHAGTADQPADLVKQMGPALFIPLQTSNSFEGVLVVARAKGEPTFDERDLVTATGLGNEAAVTMVLDRARGDKRRMTLMEDRERIARDLHDLVIQRLFASGMNLQSTLDAPERLRARAIDAIDDLDETISVIRQTIFHLTQPDVSTSGEVERLVDRHRATGRNDVSLKIDGDLDTLPSSLSEHLVPTLTELLTNVAKHADANGADVSIRWDDEQLLVSVTDDGVGMAAIDGQGFGLNNLVKRAEGLGGSATFRPGPDGVGTQVIWTLPSPAEHR